MRQYLPASLLALSLAACSCAPERERDIGNGDVLAIGDSVIEWNFNDYKSIPDFIGKETDLQADNAGVAGSKVLSGESRIPTQYVSNDWSWVIVEGGANDLGDTCGCNGECTDVIDQIVSDDASSGEIVDVIDRAEQDGAQIILLGYYDSLPGSEFEACADAMALLEERYQLIATNRDTVHYLDMGDYVTPDDESGYDPDRVHPSAKGSEAIGRGIGALINELSNNP